VKIQENQTTSPPEPTINKHKSKKCHFSKKNEEGAGTLFKFPKKTKKVQAPSSNKELPQ
jgi:hypothetical protein